jgi:outer membrane usher protein
MKFSRQSVAQVRQARRLTSSAWILKPVAALVLTAFAVSASLAGASTQASESEASAEFDTVFLNVSAQDRSGLSRFSRSDAVAPGLYAVDIWVNDSRVSHASVKFVVTDTDGNAHACLSRSMLESYGIDFAKAAADQPQAAQTPAVQDCFDLAAAVPGASVDFDFGEQRLVLSIPQKYMRNSARGYRSRRPH